MPLAGQLCILERSPLPRGHPEAPAGAQGVQDTLSVLPFVTSIASFADGKRAGVALSCQWEHTLSCQCHRGTGLCRCSDPPAPGCRSLSPAQIEVRGRSRGGTAPPRGRRADPGQRRSRRSPRGSRVPRLLGDMGVPLPALGKEHAGAIAVSAERGGTDRSVRSGGDILEWSAHTATVVMWGWN